MCTAATGVLSQFIRLLKIKKKKLLQLLCEGLAGAGLVIAFAMKIRQWVYNPFCYGPMSIHDCWNILCLQLRTTYLLECE